LWGSANEGSSQTFNGFVEGTIPLICKSSWLSLMCKIRLNSAIFAIMPVQSNLIDFNKWGELWVGISGLVEFGVLLFVTFMSHIWPMYICYGIYRVVYQITATIAQ
jgi:hypothetical protein